MYDHMLKNNKFVLAVLLIIFAAAVFLRFYKLSDYPTGFHIDEASLGYNGYSLLQTGKDENNQKFPLYIDMFGDNRPSGYHYLTILPIYFFGLTEFATRFPGALFGAISIFIIYFLSYIIFQDKKVSLVSSFLLTFAPWHVVLSRASAEAIVALFFIMLGFGFILFGITKQRSLYLAIGTFSIILSYFFYHTPRVFVPLFFLTLLIYFIPILFKKVNQFFILKLLTAFFITSFIAISLVFLISGGTGRYSQVNIFSFPETRLVMKEQTNEDGILHANLLETRSAHNKIVNYFLTFTGNYLTYFSGDFLFIKGGLPAWYVVPNLGVIYLFELPFIIIGFISAVTRKKGYEKFIILWLLVAPVTAALTVDDIPNINRAIVLFPMLEILAAYGIVTFINYFSHQYSKKIAMVGIFILFVFNFFYFQHQYFFHATIHRNWYRNFGVKEMVNEIKDVYPKYNHIVITKAAGGIYPILLFYMKYDPKMYQNEGSPKGKEYGGFGKFFFVPQACPSVDKDERFPKDKKIIYINLGTCPDSGIHYKDVLRKDGTKAFRLQFYEAI